VGGGGRRRWLALKRPEAAHFTAEKLLVRKCVHLREYSWGGAVGAVREKKRRRRPMPKRAEAANYFHMAEKFWLHRCRILEGAALGAGEGALDPQSPSPVPISLHFSKTRPSPCPPRYVEGIAEV
jgi:hypothetical protein